MAVTEHTIGIDLGTTNSVVAIIENDLPVIIQNSEGQSKTPSVVAFLENGDVVAGEIARRQGATQPQRTISSVKRLVGRLKSELEEDAELYPFQIGEDAQGRANVVIAGKHYSPEQISALILQKLKAAAEDHIGSPVKRAIITVPAYFDDVQRHATLEAARLAGLEVPRLLNEPTAAAMAYGLQKDSQETVAIYDFGGGTFDFSVLEIDGKTFEVLTSTGNSRLGGDDLDMALVDFISEKFVAATGVDLRNDYLTLRRLKDEVEKAKCELSSSKSSVINLPFIAYSEGNPLHLEETISRETLEDLIEPYVEETIECCQKAMKEAGIKRTQITKVILVGGSTRIPLVQESVEDFFGMAPFKGVNPDEIVAIGAATQAAVMDGQLEEVVLLDVTPHTLAIEIKGNRRSVLIEKNSTIPIKVVKTFTTTEDNQSFVNVHLLQGEADKASDNRSLGKFTLSDIPPAVAGVPRVRVEIFVDADGVVSLSASESHSDQESKLTTSFGYLNADERRMRQGLSGSRRHRRRRQQARPLNPSAILDASPTPPPAEPAATPVPSQTRSRSAASTIKVTPPEEESGTDSPMALPASDPVDGAASSVKPKVPEPDPVASKPAPTKAKPAATPEPVPVAARVLPVNDTPPPSVESEAPMPVGAAARSIEAAVFAETQDIMRRPEVKLAVPNVGVIPASLRPVLNLLDHDQSDPEACIVYTRERKEFINFCRQHEDDPSLQAYMVKFLIFNKQPEEARDCLVIMRKTWPDHDKEHLSLFGLLCRNYPNYIAARKDRSILAHATGDLKLAMMDLEMIAKRDDADSSVFENLSQVYEEFLKAQNDSTVQFKLVKMHLRMGALDNAITLLQQLVQLPAYRDRANKALGLCFWQKGLRYLALQKFKALTVDEEMKDILYRLATEMEEKDELLHAKYALERIYENDISFRETAERLKKLTYRIDLLKDERYGAGAPMGSAETIQESLIGDRFELLGEINRGSMGIVYKALDRTLDEIVAVKVLNDFLCSDPQAVERFKKEARSARRLSHEHIVRIHDFMEVEGRQLISMEFIEGEDMKKILSRHVTFTEDMVMNYLRQICDAMAHAHRLGIVHRDIKPANIMIDERNQVKVTDFGIAKVLNTQGTNNGTMIMGTPLYMAPEQIQGGKIDQRADIYALGIMLYELVTGSPPFYEGSIEYQHLHTPVPEIVAGISKSLKHIIQKCVQKDPGDRYQTIEELVVDLPSPSGSNPN